MKTVVLLSFLLIFAGCSKMTINCQPGRNIVATTNGPNIGTIASQLTSALGPILSAGGLVAAKRTMATAPVATASSDGTVSCSFVNIFGAATCECDDSSSATPQIVIPPTSG